MVAYKEKIQHDKNSTIVQPSENEVIVSQREQINQQQAKIKSMEINHNNIEDELTTDYIKVHIFSEVSLYTEKI